MPKLPANNLNMHYTVGGQKQPLLFIHGLGSSGRDWEAQVPFFSKDYKVVCPDIRGHGNTDKPPGPYSMELFAEDMAAFIRELNLKPVHGVGISLGGMIAFQLALDYPELLKSITIVNSAPEMIPRSLKERMQLLQRSVLFRLLSMQKIGEVISGRLFPKPDQAELRKTMIERWARNDKRAYMDAFKALVGWSVSDQIGNIHHPTLVIAADQDYTPVSVKEKYVSRMPKAQLIVIPDSRHATPLDQPEKFNETLAAFLSDQV